MQERLINPPRESPETQTVQNEREDEIIHAIASLKIQHRTVIVLYYLNALSMEEIGTILECPIGTVKSRLFYGRKKLHKILGHNKPDFIDLQFGHRPLVQLRGLNGEMV